MGKAPFIFGYTIRNSVPVMTEPDEYSGTKVVLTKDTSVIIDPNVDVNGYYLVTVQNTSGYVLKTDIVRK